MICVFCEQPVDPGSKGAWRRVVGWERKALSASRRGGSDIALREPSDEWAHDQCVRLQQQGLNASQIGFTL